MVFYLFYWIASISRQTLKSLEFEDTQKLVAKFLAQGTPFMEDMDKPKGMLSETFLLETGEEFAYITDIFYTQTLIKMRYSTREGDWITVSI